MQILGETPWYVPFSTWGEAVDIDGPVILVGDGAEGGSVSSFLRQPDGSWLRGSGFTIWGEPGEDYDGYFGKALDLDGDLAFVGRPGERGLRGAASLFQMNPQGEWTEAIRRPTPPPGHMGDEYSRSVVFAGRTAVVSGVDFLKGDYESGGYAVLIFEEMAGAWTLIHQRSIPRTSPTQSCSRGRHLADRPR